MSYLEMAKQTRRNESKLKEPTRHASVTHINTAFTVERDPDERCLLAAGWIPKDHCGPLELTIWANPETGFYCSQEVALHRLEAREIGKVGTFPTQKSARVMDSGEGLQP